MYVHSYTYVLIYMSHVANQGVMSRTKDSCDLWKNICLWKTYDSCMQESFSRTKKICCGAFWWYIYVYFDGIYMCILMVYICVSQWYIYVYLNGIYMCILCKRLLFVHKHVPTGMRHVTYEWVMSHMHESCPIWMSHVPYEWVMSHMKESCHIPLSRGKQEWVMSRMRSSVSSW